MLKSFTDNDIYTATHSPNAKAQQQGWFNQARFGLFIHWGIYSMLAHENAEWVLFKSKLNRQEYNKLTDQFTAEKFDANQLAALAKSAGMKYMVLTTKHHDGFCLYDCKATPFNSVNSAAKRDFVKEFVDACRSHDLRIGLYHSVMSWQQPAIYTGPGADPKAWEIMVQETHDQVRELMTNYGKIDMLWYDGAVVPGIQDKGMQAKFWHSHELNTMVKTLQPEILINNRSGLPADYDTPEQHVKPPRPGRRWEACMTINQSWGYNIHDRNFKTPEEIIKCLIRCSRYEGNLLLNIGPRADGSIQPECIERLEAVGKWLQRNKDAIYATKRCPYTEADHIAGPTTLKDDKLYIHINSYSGNSIFIDAVGPVKKAKILGHEKELKITPHPGNAITISGIEKAMFSLGPAVLVLKPETDLDQPARLLGGGDEPRIEAGNAPVLGDDPDRHAPPITPVLSNDFLADLIDKDTTHKIEESTDWCPGWVNWQVFTPAKSNQLNLKINVEVDGLYDLQLGIVSPKENKIQLSCNDQSINQQISLNNPGCPDTVSLNRIKLSSGNKCLSIKAEENFGLYAFRLSPIWKALPTEKWHTIGPFPTKFGPQQPVSEVRNALETAFPPEKEINLSATYTGANNKQISWAHSNSRDGDHTDCGVNFPYRCGTDTTGVCYAYTTIISPSDRKATILLGCDWWANTWINGQLATTSRDPELIEADGAQFTTWKPYPALINLKKGKNTVLVKCHPGTCANWFTFRISNPGDLEVKV